MKMHHLLHWLERQQHCAMLSIYTIEEFKIIENDKHKILIVKFDVESG